MGGCALEKGCVPNSPCPPTPLPRAEPLVPVLRAPFHRRTWGHPQEGASSAGSPGPGGPGLAHSTAQGLLLTWHRGVGNCLPLLAALAHQCRCPGGPPTRLRKASCPQRDAASALHLPDGRKASNACQGPWCKVQRAKFAWGSPAVMEGAGPQGLSTGTGRSACREE